MTLAAHKPAQAPRVKRWTKREYNQLVDLGAFQKQRIYLFRGELIEMPAMGQPHALAVVRLNKILMATFSPDFDVRIQLPFEVPGESMPEPDAAVCTPQAAQRSPHPNQAALVVEISETSLAIDRAAALEYAAAGVPDYWIINLPQRRLELHREPVADPTAPLGWRYAMVSTLADSDSLPPLARANRTIAVSQLLG